jgi:hypothetical protein
MKFLQLPLDTLMYRFYLMMAIVIVAGFSGLWFLAALALPVFFSALLGISFNRVKPSRQTKGIGSPDMKSKDQQVSATLS